MLEKLTKLSTAADSGNDAAKTGYYWACWPSRPESSCCGRSLPTLRLHHVKDMRQFVATILAQLVQHCVVAGLHMSVRLPATLHQLKENHLRLAFATHPQMPTADSPC